MNNKKLGGILLIIGALLFLILISYNYQLNKQSSMHECNPNAQCMRISSLLSVTNIFIGIIFSIISLGFYIVFFNKSEEVLLKKIEQNKKEITKEQKFEIMLKALKPEEQEVIRIIKEQEGITQSTLRIKTDFSKTKLSFILADLEKKRLIKKDLFGKTNKLYVREGILNISKQQGQI